MNRLRGAAELSRALLLETWRSKPAIFWNLVFPLLTLLLFSYIFGGGEPGPVARVVPGIMTINLLAAAFFGVSLHMVSLREKERYRRFSVTPLNALTVVVAHSVTALLNVIISSALQLGLAKALFHITIRCSPGELALTILVGAFAFIPLGLLVGSVAPDMKTAPAISNLLFFPLTFLSGASLPLYFMPAWIQKLATLLPATYFVELLQGAVLRGHPFQGAATATAILLLTGVAGFAFNALLFRWESAAPVNRRGMALAAASLAVIYGAVFLHGVRLESARAPEGQKGGVTAPIGPDTRILWGMTIIDGAGGRIERGQITVEGKRIVAVGPAGITPPKGVPVTDLSGFYLIPGLIDSHIHLGGSGGGSASADEFTPSRLVHDLQTYLALGVTSFVSLSDHVEDMQKLQRDVASGVMRSPRPYLSGPVITAVDGHPAKLFSFMFGFPEYMTRQVETPEAAEEAVREVAAMQVNIIKLYLEAGWPGKTFAVLPEPALKAAIRTAHELGLKTTVHVDSDLHARMAIEAGSDGIEHVPPDLSDETIKLMVARGVTLTPTMATSEAMARIMTGAPVTDPLALQWVDQSLRESITSPNSWLAEVRASKESADYYVKRYGQSRGALRRAVAGHVIILAGTDSGNPGVFHGPGLIRELDLLVQEGGMSPSAAIIAATSAAAQRLGTKDIGRIAPGAFADMVVLENDPEKDIGAVRNPHAVYLGGALLNRESLFTSNPGNWTPTFSIPEPKPVAKKAGRR